MESATWQVIVAIAFASVLQAIAYAIREGANNKKMSRLQTSLDGNTALCATNLVSSGNLPHAAPCIPAVAKAISSTAAGCSDAATYAQAATTVARETMRAEGIPIQSQDLLVDKLHAKISENREKVEDVAAKESRHNERDAENAKNLLELVAKLQRDMDAMKAGQTKSE